MMNTVQLKRLRTGLEGGQTLIIAIIIMGVLLILGVAFSLIVSQAVLQTGVSLRRTVANDLAKMGVEYVHQQMLASSADWAFTSTNPVVFTSDLTKDPDAMYLRQASGFIFPSSSGTVVDMGGPDGLGPYMRVESDKGRALVRVRYAPSDYDAFADPTGALRQPGAARRFLIIESVGRPGRVIVGGRVDPTRQLKEAVRIRKYADAADFAQSMAHMHGVDNRVLPSRKLLAFATLGVGDYAMFITDKNHSSRPVEIGMPSPGGGATIPDFAGVSAWYRGNPVRVELTLGVRYPEPALGRAIQWKNIPGGGSLRSNAPLIVHGDWNVALNTGLGQSIVVAGTIEAANSGSSITFSRHYYSPALDQWVSDLLTNPSTANSPIFLSAAMIDSRSPNFKTYAYAFRDGMPQTDPEGFPRGVRAIEPPVIDRIDPQGRDYFYLEITRNSGPVVNGRNIGQFGYGRGVYVNYMNPLNVQRRNDDRRDSNASNSLPDLWFNPNARDGSPAGSWQGPYFIPDAAYLRLVPDGFVITRPGNSGEQQNSEQAFWRDPLTGASTGLSTCRYRIRTIGVQTWILNSIQNPNLVSRTALALSNADFQNNGLPFEGVIYFEGDVRVRGVIPTHHQLTVLSMGSIYIDGSITKGVVTEGGAVISTPSRSMISLMARDHVAVNTTQFFAPMANDQFDTKDDSPLPDTPTPIELGVDGDSGVDSDVSLQVQFVLNNKPSPNAPSDPANPLTWRPFSMGYAAWAGFNSVGGSLAVNIMLAASANDGGPAYVSMGVLPLSYASPGAAIETAYLYSRFLDFASAGAVQFNAADPFFFPGPKIPIYGLADPSLNVFPKFEIVEFPLVTPGNWNYVAGTQRLIPNGGNPEGQYEIAVNDETRLRLRNNPVGSGGEKEFLVARTAVTPHDIRIEASIYAQEGSYYVIPGPWFNMNTDDTRERFEIAVGLFGLDEAQRRRFESFGNTPSVPFHAEPIDCRVMIVGAISQNLPAPISRQAEWMQKWGWIPREIGGTDRWIPWQHVPNGFDLNNRDTVPNFIVVHDPALAGASADGVNPLRTDALGRTLPPTPRLPVSPTLVYFGEVNP